MAAAAHEPTQFEYLDPEDDHFFFDDGYDDDFFFDDVYDHNPDRLFYGDYTFDSWDYNDVPGSYDFDDYASNGVDCDVDDNPFFHDDASGIWVCADVPDSDVCDKVLDGVYFDDEDDVFDDSHFEKNSRRGNGMDLFELIDVTPEIHSAIHANTNMATLPTRIPRWVPNFIAAVLEQTRIGWVRRDLYHAVFHNGHWWVAAGWFAYLLFPQLWGPGRDNYTTARIHMQRTHYDMQPTMDVARKDLANNGGPGTWFVRVDKIETLLLPALIWRWGRQFGAIIDSPFAVLVLQNKSTRDFLLSLLH
ncbi:hypothetical protein GGF32_005709 [Allomyces javanicus]|nr:hypothetical protein GGF32_005709 [Allomyces javanicus]